MVVNTIQNTYISRMKTIGREGDREQYVFAGDAEFLEPEGSCF